MNRIDQTFADLRRRQRKALMPFITAGFPDLSATQAILPAIDDAGASVCEIGIPFSDPIADGPVIQESMTCALQAGFRLDELFDLVARLRPKLKMALVAMVSYSIVFRRQPSCFFARAAQAGFDGLIIPDLSLEEIDQVRPLAGQHDLRLSLLIAPTSPDDRAARIAAACSGFVYLVARTGITGPRRDVPADLDRRIAVIRRACDLPVAVGFGISTADHVAAVVRHADAAIVGSALVRHIGRHRHLPADRLAQVAGDFVAELAGPLQPAP